MGLGKMIAKAALAVGGLATLATGAGGDKLGNQYRSVQQLQNRAQQERSRRQANAEASERNRSGFRKRK